MDDIKPVAYIDDDGEAADAGMIDWCRGHYGETNSVVARYKHACYPQSAIDALQEEVRRATSAVESKAGWEWKSRAERAEAEVERLRKALARAENAVEEQREILDNMGLYHAVAIDRQAG